MYGFFSFNGDGQLAKKAGGGDKQKYKEKMKNIKIKINLENVEKLEVLGNFRRKKKMGRGLGGV